ncbi:hypothetical protein D555_3231 [Bordetella holmesii 35009]|nr:hypothetical protein D555_3231 [Bordetella holmesii 35009]
MHRHPRAVDEGPGQAAEILDDPAVRTLKQPSMLTRNTPIGYTQITVRGASDQNWR